MDLHPLFVDRPPQPDPVDAGWARAVSRGPMTIAEVLERGRAEMEAEDERERQARDPIAYIRAHRPRTLWNRLLGR
jgi:hypothetical protein